MFLNPFKTRSDPHSLLVHMTGVKMGDRLIQIGCAHGGRLAAVACKVGLSGHAAAMVPDEASARRAREGAAGAGALIEVTVAPLTKLPAGDGAFDLAVVDDTGHLLAAMTPDDRAALAGELFRLLRPGGRVVVISATAPQGLSAIFKPRSTGAAPDPAADATGAAQLAPFDARGFKALRTLGSREGLAFVEAIKPRHS